MVATHVLAGASLAPGGVRVGTAAGLGSTPPRRIVYLLAGVVVLVVAIVDVVWTALWADGGSGPLSSRLTTLGWRGLRATPVRRTRAMSLAGPLILVATLAMWVALVWGGWVLVFAGGETVLVDTRDGGPIGWIERIYFVAYTMFTMGNGDFVPTDGAPQIATALTTATGMLSVTMAVSYVLSVLGAVVEKRSFANTVSGVGTRCEALALAGWNGDDFHELDHLLDTLSSDLGRLAKEHRAYPIVHYYHSEREEDSAAMAVAIFDDALTLLRFGLPDESKYNRALVEAGRSSVDTYLRALESAYIEPADEAPPEPDLDRLREAGVPTVSDEAFREALDELNERRRKLRGVVDADAWHWPPVDDD